jgi:hypothetical protein
MNTIAPLLACPMCTTGSGSSTTATNGAVFFMLGLLGFMFVCLVITVVVFARRQKKFAQSQAALLS